ncbi:alpha/beta fold hydrolase [Brevibacillus choshinensis]|uniref:Alpha/beta hydrolase n=1 Tax=Brevibacillus choshinensis TaxID=54911 RepID=A0ABX7FMJ5_BRECH|nr:alpha/beta hydrolase [Brevibacillus choshinensis]QRG67468.1 alpha/beta hydrolase [Brevibacillus choshinensis]
MSVPVFTTVKSITRAGFAMEYGLAGPNDAPVLLMLHAIRNTKMLFAGIVPALAQHFRVVAVDLRGHGHSSGTSEYSFEAIVDDLIELLDAEAIEQVTVVAASFSAVPAQMLAVREPRRVARLVLLDGGFYQLGEMPGFQLPAVVERLTATRFVSVKDAEGQFSSRYGNGNLPEGWMATELEQKQDGGYGYVLSREAWTAYFREYMEFDKEALFREVVCPVLLVLADESLLPDDEQRRFYRDAVDSYKKLVTQARIRSIPKSLHLLMVTHPEETVREIMAFTKE